MMGGNLTPLFGTRGVDNDGTDTGVDVDPFLLCHFVSIPSETGEMKKPPFCAHPHTGTAVATLLFEGCDMRPWDNVQGYEKDKLHAGGVYLVCSGQGCVHDEGHEPVHMGVSSYGKADFGITISDGGSKPFRMCQLWFDAGHIHREGGPPPVSSIVVQPEQVSLLAGGSMRMRLLLGNYGGQASYEGTSQVGVTVLHCALLPFVGPGQMTIPAGTNAFVFCMARGARVTLTSLTEGVGHSDIILPPRQELLLPPSSDGYEVSVEVDVGEKSEEACADDALELLVGYGVPAGKPFCKLLGYGGALVADTEAKVRALMCQYEKDPKHFGIPAGERHTEDGMADYGFQVGYKDPMDGRGECQKKEPSAVAPEARWYPLASGPYQPKGSGKGSAQVGSAGRADDGQGKVDDSKP